MEQEEIIIIAKMIRYADWYYQYSDDYSVYLKGEAEVSKVKNYVQSKDWDQINFAKLIDVFFKDANRTFPNEESLQSYKEVWTSRIKQLTGVN